MKIQKYIGFFFLLRTLEVNANVITVNIVIPEMNSTIIPVRVRSESDIGILCNFTCNGCAFEEFYLQRNFLMGGVVYSQVVPLLPGRTFLSYGTLNGSAIIAKGILIPIHILYDFYGETKVENRLIGINQKVDCFFIQDLGGYRFSRFFIKATGQEIVDPQALPQAYNIVPHTNIVATDMEIFVHTALVSSPLKDNRWIPVENKVSSLYSIDDNIDPFCLISYNEKTLDPDKTFYEQGVLPDASIVLDVPQEKQRITDLQINLMGPKELYETWLWREENFYTGESPASGPTIIPEPATAPSTEPLPVIGF